MKSQSDIEEFGGSIHDANTKAFEPATQESDNTTTDDKKLEVEEKIKTKLHIGLIRYDYKIR